MQHDTQSSAQRPPLRTFEVTTVKANGVDEEKHTVVAHLVFDNNNRGEGLVFRRYYDDSVRTEKVAQFYNWTHYKEIANV